MSRTRVVERGRPGGRRRADPADELRVGREVAEGRAAVQPLRRERDEEVRVGAEAGGRFEPRREPLAGVADRERRLEDHERAGVDAGRDRVDGAVHVAVVGLLRLVEHDRHDQDHDVRLARRRGAVGRGPQPAAGVGGRDELGETRLLGDVRAPGVDRVDHRLLDVDRDHVPIVVGELGRQGQAHLARADDRDRPGGAGLGDPRLRLDGGLVAAGVERQLDGAAEQALDGRSGG